MACEARLKSRGYIPLANEDATWATASGIPLFGWRKVNVRSATEGDNRGFPLKHPHRDEPLQDAQHALEVGWVYAYEHCF